MLHFPVIRTRRLTVALRELTMGESITLAAMPESLPEAACTQFLKSIIVEITNGPQDPALWTVEERMLIVGQYLAGVADDGPDFSLGGESRYSDYLDGAADGATIEADAGELAGDTWKVRHLTGAMAEAIERHQGELDLPLAAHWLTGAMATMLFRPGEELPEPGTGAFDEWLLDRMRILLGFPASDFGYLTVLFHQGRDALRHLFTLDFTDDGIVALAKEGAGDVHPPARFPVYDALSPLAQSLARRTAEPVPDPESVHEYEPEGRADIAGFNGP